MIEPVAAYVRKAKYVANHDGDNVTLALDHGKFPTSKAVTEAELRIKGLYAPELDEPGGIEAREFIHVTCIEAIRITVQTYNTGSFARTLADVWVDGRLLADVAIAAGHGTREPR